MKIIIVGQGKMGLQITQQVIEGGNEVLAMDPNPDNQERATSKGATVVETRSAAIAEFQSSEQQPLVWLMVPSSVVDAEFNAWLNVLPEGSIIVDGGNSDFRLTKQRGESAMSKSIHLVDVGVSGGVLGLVNGFSMMVGGKEEAFKTIEPILQCMAKASGGYAYFGPEYGAGHFIKMTHNAIEYGVMESLAEGYQLINDGPYKNLDLAAIGDVWQRGSVIESELNALAAKALRENPKLDGVDGYVAESGEARWSLEASKDAGVNMPAVQASFDVRVASQNGQVNFATKLLAELRNQFGGHNINKES